LRKVKLKFQQYKLHCNLGKRFWYFTSKTNLIRQVIKKSDSANLTPLYILDVGCGTGANLQMLSGFGKSFGLDNSLAALYFCKKNNISNLIIGNVTEDLPFRDEQFDLVCAIDLLEHLQEETQALREMRRILKRGASLIITVPAYKLLWSEHDLSAGHMRRYSKENLIEKLNSSGFLIKRCTYFNCFAFLPTFFFRKIIRQFLEGGNHNDRLRLDFEFKIPQVINIFFSWFSRLEVLLLKYINFPFGVSLICICKKGKSND